MGSFDYIACQKLRLDLSFKLISIISFSKTSRQNSNIENAEVSLRSDTCGSEVTCPIYILRLQCREGIVNMITH